MMKVDLGTMLALTPPGMVAVLFLALWRGLLVPGSTLDRLTKLWEERLREARNREDSWKTAHDKQQDVARMAAQQTQELLESLGVIEVFIRGNPSAREQLRALPTMEERGA